MSQLIEIELPDEIASMKFPRGLDLRLEALLSKQDEGVALSEAEQLEAQGLVELAEMLTLLKLRSKRRS